MPVAPARKMGTWKVAYADFLTALMAFFLVLWLVSGTSPDDRSALASYFTGKEVTAEANAPIMVATNAPNVLDALKRHAVLETAPESVRITETPEFIRVDLVDSDNRPLFQTGYGEMTASGQRLASSVGEALAPFSNGISIEGHTDAFAGADDTFSNWDLSSERAHDARRQLAQAGIAADRFRAVTGLADTRPLKPGQPHLSANRRVSILIHIGG